MFRRMKFLTIALVVLLVTGILAGCGPAKPGNTTNTSTQNQNTEQTGESDGTPSYMNATGYPIVKEPITLNFMVAAGDTGVPYPEIAAWKEYEKISGIKINWDVGPMANITEKRNLAFASGDLPDAFYRVLMPDRDMIIYGESGVLIELNDLIDKYGPNIKAVMEEYPYLKSSLPAYNGKIYGFPTITEATPSLMNLKYWVNMKWLDKVGMKKPTTTDELYEMLKAFKNGDPNGNGIADEIPWSVAYTTDVYNTLRGAWGLVNKGRGHENVDLVDGKLRFIPTSEQYKEVLMFINKLFNEGLIDQELYTITPANLLAKGDDNLIGSFSFTNTSVVGTKYGDDFDSIDVALKGPQGDQLWTMIRQGLGDRAAFTITNKNKYPEATVRWVDFFYSFEGAKLYRLGVEGVHHVKKPDGTYDYSDAINDQIAKSAKKDLVITTFTPFPGGKNPEMAYEEFDNIGATGANVIEATKKMMPYVPELWGPFNFSMDESDRMKSLENDILTYVKQMSAQFILGEASFDQWDIYVDKINKMGLDEYMAIYTAAYERYVAE